MTGKQPPRRAAMDPGQAWQVTDAQRRSLAGLPGDLSDERRRPSLGTGWTVRDGRNVNRIRMLKRQMYDRARFDLLRKRALLA